jgi:hypothetical protein
MTVLRGDGSGRAAGPRPHGAIPAMGVPFARRGPPRLRAGRARSPRGVSAACGARTRGRVCGAGVLRFQTIAIIAMIQLPSLNSVVAVEGRRGGAPVAGVEGEADGEGVAAEELVDGAGGDGAHAGGGALVPREIAVRVRAVLRAHALVVAERVGGGDDDDRAGVDEAPRPGAAGVHLEERGRKFDHGSRADALVAVERATEEDLGGCAGAETLVADDEYVHLICAIGIHHICRC